MIKEQKDKLRKEIKEKKKLYSLDEKKAKSKVIFNKVKLLEEFQTAKTILVYWSMPDEVFTHDFVLGQANSKTILLPVVKDDELDLKFFKGVENMVVGKAFGIEEPVGENFDQLKEIDLIIVPGVAFDKNKNRLGRGKAYYDKLLKLTNAYKVGVCFDFQYIDHVPVDQFDVRMDLVIHD